MTSITIGKQWKLHGNRLFNNWNGLLIGVEIPSSVKIINQKEVEITPLEHYDVPENIYKIYDHCFEDCYSLKTITIPSTVKYIGKDAFKAYDRDTSFVYCLTRNKETEIGSSWVNYTKKIIFEFDDIAIIEKDSFGENITKGKFLLSFPREENEDSIGNSLISVS